MHCQNIVDEIKFTFQTLQTDIFWTLSWPFSCDYSFWLRDLKLGVCIKDPINKTCRKNGKDLSNGAPKNKLWNHTKKRIFRVLPKISAGHGWSWKFFFANFQTLGLLGCQGWVVIPQNVKKVKITAPYSAICIYRVGNGIVQVKHQEEFFQIQEGPQNLMAFDDFFLLLFNNFLNPK